MLWAVSTHQVVRGQVEEEVQPQVIVRIELVEAGQVGVFLEACRAIRAVITHGE